MGEVLRQEKKFLLTYPEFQNCSKQFDQILKPDIHNKEETGYLIRSLYFDTIYNQDFNEKEDGLEKRKKIRLRIYDTKQNFAMLEMKQKDGSNQKKRSLKIKKEHATQLILGNYEVLLNYNDSFAIECFAVMNTQCYRPKSVVEYKRKAYVAKENNIRVTFDYDIRVTESNFNIFDEELALNPIFQDSKVVLEVKYNNFLLSYIQDVLNTTDKSEVSVSKYCFSRSTTMKYVF